VWVADVRRNYRAIGAVALDSPRGGSHYKLRFEGRRPWPLDPNDDPVPPRYLDKLAVIASLPLPVLVSALLTGDLPDSEFRLSRYRAAATV